MAKCDKYIDTNIYIKHIYNVYIYILYIFVCVNTGHDIPDIVWLNVINI